MTRMARRIRQWARRFPTSRPVRARLLGIGAGLGVCASLALSAVGCAVAEPAVAGGTVSGAASADPTAEESPMPELRVTEQTVPGPAAGMPAFPTGAEHPNRVGSARVPVRVYEPGPDAEEPWATLVWAHGGSFVRGDLDWPEADWASRRLAAAGLRVYSVDYALASDTVKAPAPAADVAAVLREAASRHDGAILVGGASAGAHLAVAAALAQAARAEESGEALLRPAALALVYPTLHRVQRPTPEISALTEGLPEQRRFSAARIAEMYEFYLGTEAAPGVAADPTAEVVGELPASRLAVLPPVVVVNAEADDLRASAEQFAEQLREAGVPVTERVQPGTVHGYLNRPEADAAATRDAQATIDALVEGLRAILVP